MTLPLDEADVVIQAAERHGLRLMVNVQHSFDPHVRKIREVVQSGELGGLRMLHTKPPCRPLHTSRGQSERRNR
jgi:phthalate 4,5-cis-dihydrodiol dehydrogenase